MTKRADITNLGKFGKIQGPLFEIGNLPDYLSWARYYAFKHCDQVSWGHGENYYFKDYTSANAVRKYLLSIPCSRQAAVILVSYNWNIQTGQLSLKLFIPVHDSHYHSKKTCYYVWYLQSQINPCYRKSWFNT